MEITIDEIELEPNYAIRCRVCGKTPTVDVKKKEHITHLEFCDECSFGVCIFTESKHQDKES